MRTGRPPKPLEERFWEKVDKRGPDECWPWTARVSEWGYGMIRVGDTHEAAHRVSYELHNGPIPEGELVRHRCDNRPCCNPAHLLTGTHQDNMDDKTERDRQYRPQGEKHHSAKLTEPDVIEIKRLLKETARTQKDIASQFGVARNTIAQIKHGHTWGHIL